MQQQQPPRQGREMALGELSTSNQIRALATIWEAMRASWSTSFRLSDPSENGELTITGKTWIQALGDWSTQNFISALPELQASWLQKAPTLAEIKAILAAKHPPQPRSSHAALPPPRPGDWLERLHRENIDQNPAWRKSPDESSKEYGARMANEARALIQEVKANILINQE